MNPVTEKILEVFCTEKQELAKELPEALLVQIIENTTRIYEELKGSVRPFESE